MGDPNSRKAIVPLGKENAVKMPLSCAIAVLSLLAVTGALAYVHPGDCYFNVQGIQQAVVPTPWAIDTPGEPQSTEEWSDTFSEVFFRGGPIKPEAQTIDMWSGLPSSTEDSGGGYAGKEGEAWHQILMTGTWTFEHKVKQNWTVAAYAATYPIDNGYSSAYAFGRGFIRDDRASEVDVLIAEALNNEDDSDSRLLSTVMTPDIFVAGEDGWVNVCGTTIATATGTWFGRAESHGGAAAEEDLVIVISNILDIG